MWRYMLLVVAAMWLFGRWGRYIDRRSLTSKDPVHRHPEGWKDCGGVCDRFFNDSRISRPAGTDQAASCVQTPCCPYIARGIANHEGHRRIDPVFTRGTFV